MVRKLSWRVLVVGLLIFGWMPAVVVVTSVQPAAAATAINLYVSSGSTGTTCTFSDQCGSVSTAANVATSGPYNGDDVTIQVAAGTYGASGSGDDPNFDASSLDSLTIAGAGAPSTTVNGGFSGTVFTIVNGTVTITGLTITGGYGGIDGGAISIAAGTVTIENDTLSNDLSAGSGGGINDDSTGTVTVANDTLTDDRADPGGGGGIYAFAGQINIYNDTLNFGQAESGSAVELTGTASGSLVDDTLANGEAQEPGGATGVEVQQLASATITSSILDDSSCAAFVSGGGGIGNGGYNVETGPDTCGFGTNPTNVVLPPLSYVPGLADSLAANGSSGPETFGLAPGDSTTSPAFELVPAPACALTTDERGSPRPGVPGQNCDAGAYEFDPARDVAVTTASLPNGSVYSKTNKVIYSATLEAAGGNLPYKWSLPPGYESQLPPGLKLRKSSGLIYGRATTPGTYYFTVEVVDKKAKAKPHTQAFATADLSITIGS